jgi:DNA-binding transcriptional MerR regulator
VTSGNLAPSGRCLACEAAGDIPTTDEPSLRQIGEVANLVGLSLRTVRHYEDAGLVLPAARSPGGFRLYDDDAVERLRLIMQMKPLGFSLEEMRLLIHIKTRLNDSDVDDEERADLEERLGMFSITAAEKCRHLREQLAIAEAFAATIASETLSGSGKTSPDAANPRSDDAAASS